jgi:23S rRNA pseudouridine1911/1915/1917 synthase
MQPEGFTILLEDGPVLVVDKPGGLLTQAPPGIDSLETRVKRFLKVRDDKPGKVYLAVTHRLDRPVSGAIILAKHVRAAQRIGKQFEERRIEKVYWAVVEGEIAEESGTWSDYLRKIPDQPRSEVVPHDHPEGKIAILNYRVLGRDSGRTWLEIELVTGRTHQIRVQASSRGTPVLGDFFYGAVSSFGPASDDERERIIALHARRTAFEHPMTKEPIRLEAPLPEAWKALEFTGLNV